MNDSTIRHKLQTRVVAFGKKLTQGQSRPIQKFVTSMLYGLLSAKSCFLSDIARELHESIQLRKTVNRLSRNLNSLDCGEELTEKYMKAVESCFDASTILLFDDSDVSKPCSKKLEGLCRVHDGSRGETADGYWVAGVSALSATHKQPIPVYSRVYSSKEADYVSNNAETIKSLEFCSKYFQKNHIRAFDRGYDAGYVFDYLIPNDENFIVRMCYNRNVIHENKPILIEKLVSKFKGKYKLRFESVSGKKSVCKISMTSVSLPNYPNKRLNLVICVGLGQKPMVLLTNLKNDDNRLCVTVTKAYLMRWRIEEYYKFKKQTYNYEKFLVRSLKSIRNLDILLTFTIGFVGMLSEQLDESIEVWHVIEAAKRLDEIAKRFKFYAIADGLYALFRRSAVGLRSFLAPKIRSNQFALPGF